MELTKKGNKFDDSSDEEDYIDNAILSSIDTRR